MRAIDDRSIRGILMTHGRANIVLLLAGAIWGFGFVAQSSAMGSIGPFMFVTLRFFLAALTIIPLAVREAKTAPAKLRRADYYGFFFIGVLLFSGAALQQVGMQTTSVTNAVPCRHFVLAVASPGCLALRFDGACRHLSVVRRAS
jgi:drug/metabolite transporter (DMT)-like permease